MPDEEPIELFPQQDKDRIMLRVLIAALILLNATVISMVLLGIQQLQDQKIREAEIHSQNIALAIDLSLSAQISKIDLSLKTVIGDMGRFDKTHKADKWEMTSFIMAQQKLLLPEVEGWTVVDANGMVFLHQGDTTHQRFDVADRDYFKALQADTTDRLLISGPVLSRATGSFVLIFGRRIVKPNGDFDGIVVIALPMSYINRVMCGYDIGRRGTLTLRNQNLDVITRVITDQRGDVALMSTASLSAEFSKLIESGITHGTYTAVIPFDTVDRIASYRKLDYGDLYAVVGISKEDHLSDWRKIAWRFLGFLAVFLCIANGSAWIMYRLWQRQHRSLRQLQERDNALVSAQQAGRLGTYILDLRNGEWTSSEMLDTIFGIEASPLHTIADWTNLLHEDDRESMSQYFFYDVVARHQDFDREYRITRPCDGKTVWVHGLGRLEFAEDGRPVKMLGTIQDVTALHIAQDDLKRMAYYDVMTGLANRALLADRMRQAISRCKRNEGELLAICHLDLDGFKEVNDHWGHDVGDKLLKKVAERFQGAVRSNETIARLGGDEFVVVFGDLKDILAVENAVSRLIERASRPYHVDGIVLSSTVSIGVTVYPHDASDEPDALIRHADQAMYEAKRNGKNRIHFFDPENEKALKDRQEKHKRMLDALANDELLLYYQPKVDLQTGAVTGVEALIRWQHPEDGLLQPGQFLPTIETTELTLPVGEWVLHEAIRQKREWLSQGIDLAISVNVFALHMQRADFHDRLRDILSLYPDVDPGGLELEILETTSLGDLAVISKRIEFCTALGVQFSLDDFGTGYSSLTYLRNLPVSTVKIDRSFVRDLLDDREDQALVQGLIVMAHAVQRIVVAEGVETMEHAAALSRCGCDRAQGFGIGRPMPPEAIPAWLNSWQGATAWKGYN